jgi:hypothetical protein
MCHQHTVPAVRQAIRVTGPPKTASAALGMLPSLRERPEDNSAGGVRLCSTVQKIAIFADEMSGISAFP